MNIRAIRYGVCLLVTGLCIVLSGCSDPLPGDMTVKVIPVKYLAGALEMDKFRFAWLGDAIHDVELKIFFLESEGNFGSEGGERVRTFRFDSWEKEERKDVEPVDTVIDRILKIRIELKAREGHFEKEWTKDQIRVREETYRSLLE